MPRGAGSSLRPLVRYTSNGIQPHNCRYALCTMCIGVGQGIAIVLERV